GLEPPGELGKPLRFEEVRVGEAGFMEDERCWGGGRLHPAGEVNLQRGGRSLGSGRVGRCRGHGTATPNVPPYDSYAGRPSNAGALREGFARSPALTHERP